MPKYTEENVQNKLLVFAFENQSIFFSKNSHCTYFSTMTS